MRFCSLVFGSLLLVIHFGCASGLSGQSLNAADFSKRATASNNKIILDVRTAGEFASGHLANASNVDYNADSFRLVVERFDKQKTYFVYCLSGGRSSSAASFMRKHGFGQVYELSGGIIAWKRAGLPLTTTATPSAADRISAQVWQTMVNQSIPVLIDFYAPWCAPCRKMEPVLQEMTRQYVGKVAIIRINYDENKHLMDTLNVASVPEFRLYQGGKEQWNHSGAISRQELENVLNAAIGSR